MTHDEAKELAERLMREAGLDPEIAYGDEGSASITVYTKRGRKYADIECFGDEEGGVVALTSDRIHASTIWSISTPEEMVEAVARIQKFMGK